MWGEQVCRGEVEEQEFIFRSVNSHGQCINFLDVLLHINVSCSGYIMKLEELTKCVFIDRLATGG